MGNVPSMLTWRRWSVIIGIAAAFAMVSGFALGRTLLGDGAARAGDSAGPTNQSEFPSPDETPLPGSTPDKTQPYWYVPYLNQDAMRPAFRGVINGISVGVDNGYAPSCDGLFIARDWQQALSGTALDINVENLPQGVAIVSEPTVGVCPDGEPLWVTNLVLSVEPNVEGSDPGGSTIVIDRWTGVNWWPQEAPLHRWSSGEIQGRPAAFLSSIIDTVGESAVIVLDAETDGSTRVVGISASLDLTISLTEALYR